MSTAMPTFRTDAEADLYAERHRPFARALTKDVCVALVYAERYGRRAAQSTWDGFYAAHDGDDHRLHLSMIALSHRLFIDRPDLFEPKDRPHGQKR